MHTLTERVAITEGHLFRVAFAIFFQLSQAAVFSPHHLLSFGSRGFDVLRGPALCSLRYSPSPV
ncbi:hypothetical protein [Escherichia coli]|uniref:hypothetical protein n=1 Tax=Escherichia coli TaxID=562 RepID=UPI003D9CA6CC